MVVHVGDIADHRDLPSVDQLPEGSFGFGPEALVGLRSVDTDESDCHVCARRMVHLDRVAIRDRGDDGGLGLADQGRAGRTRRLATGDERADEDHGHQDGKSGEPPSFVEEWLLAHTGRVSRRP